jgi:hypothetical protein
MKLFGVYWYNINTNKQYFNSTLFDTMKGIFLVLFFLILDGLGTLACFHSELA